MPLRAPELIVPSATAWRTWLSQNASSTPHIWLVACKSTASPLSSTLTTLTYPAALDEALCYGWIDSGGCSRDKFTRYIRFGPRKAKSPWSKRNIGFIERLEREGRMAEEGLLAVAQAKANGFWEAAYAAGEVPGDLMGEIDREGAAVTGAWERVGKKERYALFVRLGALPVGSEGRRKRIRLFVEGLVGEGINEAEQRESVKEKKASLVSSSVVTKPVTRGTRSSRRLATAGVART